MKPATPEEIIQAVGRKIAEVRIERGWTQDDLARRLNVTLRHVKRLEAGHNMTLHTAARVAASLGVEIVTLFIPPASLKKPRPGRPKGLTA